MTLNHVTLDDKYDLAQEPDLPHRHQAIVRLLADAARARPRAPG